MSHSEPVDISDIPLDQLIETLRKYDGFIWLDSSDDSSQHSKFSFLMVSPIATLHGNPSRDEMSHFFNYWLSYGETPIDHEGCIAGYIGYEAISQWNLDEFRRINFNLPTFPSVYLGVYPMIIRINHTTQETHIISNKMLSNRSPRDFENEIRRSVNFCPTGYSITLEPTDEKSAYIKQTRSALEHIKNGNIYQINLSRRIRGSFFGDPLSLYTSMRRTNPSPYGAYIATNNVHILSMSPELLFKTKNRVIHSSPIKGTSKRVHGHDETAIQSLAESEKNNAELLMIVDLIRNDLGKLCKPGSIKVEKIKRVETFSTVHHLVADIIGNLPDSVSTMDIFASLFPGGSITGAPKAKSMEIINELEDTPRGVYTGSIGYVSMNQHHEFNVAIRTATIQSGTIEYSTGCGIVADSTPEDEWAESELKAVAFKRIACTHR